MNNTINFFFAYKSELGEIEQLSLTSFHKHGYECVLWCYDEIGNVPDYVVIKDASEIIQYNPDIYVAHLSDEFRMLLLNKYGGTYSDLDNILLKRLPDTPYILAGKYGDTINNIIRTPKSDILTTYLVQNREVINHAPKLHMSIVEFGLEEWIIDAVDINYFYNGISVLAVEEIDWNTVNSYMIHLFSSMHRVCYKSNKIYNLNMENLKKLINE